MRAVQRPSLSRKLAAWKNEETREKNTSKILLVVMAALTLGIAGCDSHGSWSLAGLFHEKKPASPPPPATDPVPPTSDSTAPSGPAPAEASAPAPPDTATRPFHFLRDGQDTVSSNPAQCGFDHFVPAANTKVFATGAYSGRTLDFQIDQSGHQATQIDVAVNHRGTPVVLMLGAYEPTIWNIGWSQGTQIAAVLVGGYHRQVIAGLPSSVPTLISSYDNKGACGYFYISADKLDGLNPKSRKVFGRAVDMVYPAKDGRAVIGDALTPSDSLVTGTGKSPEAYRAVDTPLAGPAGLTDAVSKGLLREATTADAQPWAVAQAALPTLADVPPVAGVGRPQPKAPGLYNAYVVLKPMVVPAGLYGANAATFFAPRGVPRPTGNLGHSHLYDFNTLTCAGLTCRDE